MTEPTITLSQLEELAALEAKATKGPWQWSHGLAPYDPTAWTLSPGVLIADETDGTPGGDRIDRANAALIAAARNHLPALIALAREALEARERRATLEKFASSMVTFPAAGLLRDEDYEP